MEDKENHVPPTTPTKNIVVSDTFQTTGAILSPLSPSKRTIHVNALESPTKRFRRLQISSGSMIVILPPPKINLLVG